MPQPKKEPTEPAPETEPAPAPDNGVEAALREVRQVLDNLPNQIRASLTEQDHRSIAEYVHDMFERSGAFEKPEPAGEQPSATEPPADTPAGDATPHKPTLAEKMFGSGL